MARWLGRWLVSLGNCLNERVRKVHILVGRKGGSSVETIEPPSHPKEYTE